MEKMMSNLMKMNGVKDFSNRPDDDPHLTNLILCPRTEEQSSKVKKHRKRKPRNNEGQNAAVSLKRKLTDDQAARLELYFESEPRLETERKERIAAELDLEPRQVAVWFQNRRARWKCKKLEDEFANLRTSHYSALGQKAQLEAQVSELNVRLMEAEEEIHRLSTRFEMSASQSNDNMSGTPSSSMSMDQAGMFQDVMQQLENDYVQMMDYYWMSNTMYI